MTRIELKNGFTYEGSAWSELLDATVIETVEQSELVTDYKETKNILWFIKQPIFSPNQTFSSKYAWGGLSEKEEMEVTKLREMIFWPKKGVYVQEFSEKFMISKTLTDWLRVSKTIKWASETVQADLLKVPSQIKDLYYAYDITLSDLLAKVITLGFSISSAEWPGSATPKGKSLFADNHVVKDWNWEDIVFSNKYAENIDYNDLTSGRKFLQKAIDSLKTFKLDGWRKIMQPKKGYTLICSREREVFWKQVINDGKNTSAFWNNNWIANQFTFEWNLVNIKVLENIWDYDKISGENIGNNNMAFVLNSEYLEKAEALKYYILVNPELSNWEDKDVWVIFNKLRCSIGADHFDAELGVYGYAG